MTHDATYSKIQLWLVITGEWQHCKAYTREIFFSETGARVRVRASLPAEKYVRLWRCVSCMYVCACSGAFVPTLRVKTYGKVETSLIRVHSPSLFFLHFLIFVFSFPQLFSLSSRLRSYFIVFRSTVQSAPVFSSVALFSFFFTVRTSYIFKSNEKKGREE